ncbi:hypothetical protein JCM3774_006564 [Rhodotorula dairenensis]
MEGASQGAMRPLALLERYQLSRINVGVPATVCFTALVRLAPAPAPSDSDSDLGVALSDAVGVLLDRYPLLQCTVNGARTAAPRWQRMPDPVDPARFLSLEPLVGATNHGAVISAAFESMSRVDPEHDPMWRVWAYTPAAADSDSDSVRIVYATNHILTDGTGARNLFADLLALVLHPRSHHSSSASAASASTAATEVAPAMEAVFDLSSSYLALAKLVWTEFLRPKLAAPRLLLPSFLASPVPATEAFHQKPLVPPHLQPTAVRTGLVDLPAQVVTDLKAVARRNGVKTLHPVLYVAAWAAIEAQISSDASSSRVVPITVVGSTPASVRTLAPSRLPTATGNYVYEVHTSHSPRPTPATTNFWSECRSYAEKLIEPATRRNGLEAIGHLSLVPDGPLTLAAAEKQQGQSHRQPTTKFDAWMVERSRKAEPFETTFEVSNLGVLPSITTTTRIGDDAHTEPRGRDETGELVELAWAQTAMTGTIFAINPIATPAGDLSFTLTYRAGTVPESLVDAVWSSYGRILRTLATDQIPAEEATFARLADASTASSESS